MVDVAQGERDGAGGVDDHDGASVPALDLVAPGDLHEDRRRAPGVGFRRERHGRDRTAAACAGVLGPVRRAPVLSIGIGAGVLWR